MPDNVPPDTHIENPPTTIWGTMQRLGPGMIIAGSIVGSGELIATTKTGAEAGFWLLWLIIIGCVIKVFCQVELGRHTITHSETPLDAMNKIPGPRLKVNWLVWAWAIMTLTIITQQGGIMGGVGQALSISVPLTNQGIEYNELDAKRTELKIAKAKTLKSSPADITLLVQDFDTKIKELDNKITTLGKPKDTFIWVAIVGVSTAILLYFGRFFLIQMVSTVLVVSFTIITIFTLFRLQMNPDWAITSSEFGDGLKFNLPPGNENATSYDWGPLKTALMTFGIIGVGTSELMMYPYWCLEKGYAKYTGTREQTKEWVQRAKGWMRVMRFDAWFSMVIYTFSTIAFYLLGAAVLNRAGMVPEGGNMIRTLSQMYVPVFGESADTIFLIGAFAVLYSTLFVAGAGNARMLADGLGLFGLLNRDEESRLKWSRRLSGIWILGATFLYIFLGYVLERESPAAMVLLAGLSQAIILPMVGIAALYFRYKRADEQLKPGTAWDIFLWISFAGFVLVGVVTIISKL